jgi:hypothetical protein
MNDSGATDSQAQGFPGRGLAAFAWEHYLDRARACRYLAVNDPAMKDFPDLEGSKEQSWTDSYDPAERVIVVVLQHDSSISSYFLGAKPSPPDAYALVKAAEN